MLVHVPGVPASAHDLQIPVQVVAQQTPCAQMPLAQSPPAAHVAPLGRLVQTPPMQTFGETQSPSTVQVVRQAPEPHANGSHIDVAAAWQVPVPLQVRADVSVEPVQLAAAHWVPAAYSRQAPPPLQVPSWPQVPAPASVHWFRGSVPFGTFEQVPSAPATAQERQVPVQAPVQQIPCSQNPELHWAGAVQAALIGSRPQLVPEQVFGEAQSAVVPQVVRHAPLPQA